MAPCHVVNDLLAGASHLCSYGCGIRGIARVHLPESYFLPSITGRPCIAHICARAIESLRFRSRTSTHTHTHMSCVKLRTVRQRRANYVSFFFFPIGEKKISFLREICKIHSTIVRKKGNRSERGREGGDIVAPVDRYPSATNHHKAQYKCSALVLLGYLSKHAANISFFTPLSSYYSPIFFPLFFPFFLFRETLFCYTHS